MIVISFLEIINILKLSIAYIIANTSAFILLIFPFSLYFPLLYLQNFSVFLAKYLWGYANNTAPILGYIRLFQLLNNHLLMVGLMVVIL